MEKNKFNWEILVSAFVIVASNLGVLIPLFTHLDNKTEARMILFQEDSKRFHEKWAQETKEFHGRLIAIEESRRQK